MIKIKFNNKSEFDEVSFSRTENIITLKGITEENTSGFTTWRLDGITQLGDFSDFTTVYRKGEDFIEYSNNYTVYVEPIPPTEEEIKKQELLKEKAELEVWLKDHDYVGTKISTGRATKEEYADVISLMSEKAERINQIDIELGELIN